MEFWRIYRLIYAKRWLILATIIIAALVILIGTSLQAQKREYEATAILQPQINTLPDVIGRTGEGAASAAAASTAQDSQSTVSDVIMILRSSNDLYNKTADLLREDEGLRLVEVQRILDRNAYFSSVDNEIQMEANRRVKKGDLTQAGANAWIATNKQAARTRTVDQLAKGRDASGAFASAGLPLSQEEIAGRIRENITFDTVLGPLSTDTVPQISDEIQVTAKFDREAEAVLYENLLCVEFLDYYTNERTSGVNAKITQLNEMLETAKSKLQSAKRDETEFRQESGVLLTTAAEATVNRAQALQTQRDEAEREFRGADAAVAQIQASLQTAQASRTTSLPPEENPEVRNLRALVDEAYVNFETVASSNEGAPNNEKYIIAHARLAEVKKQLSQALARRYTTTAVSVAPEDLQSKLNAAMVQRSEAQQHLAVADKQLQAQHAEMATLPAADNRLADLRREIALKDQNVRELETTRDRLMEYGVEHGSAGTINIVSAAHSTPIVSRIAAQRGKLIVYGMALALFFGIVLVVAMDALDNSIRTAEDVEKLTGLPVAGVIPEHLPDPARSPRVSLIEPLSAAAEAYRMLRTYLLFTDADRPFRSLLMATAKPGQGTTTTLSNLAIVLAQSGRRVILVDADLRYPKLDRVFRRSNDIGLTTVLTDRCRIEDALVPTEVEGLTLLPAGPFVNNPSELLGSTRMHGLHEHLKSIADFVLFDTPSAVSFADTPVLAAFLDATLMVVRADGVPRGTEMQVQTMLMKAKANLIGAVLNGVVADKVDSVHFHETYYPALTGVGNGYSDDKQVSNGQSTLSGYSARNGASGKNGDEALAIALPENSRSYGKAVTTTAVAPLPDGDTAEDFTTDNRPDQTASGGSDPINIRRENGTRPVSAAPSRGPESDSPTQGIVAKKRQAFQMKAVMLVVIAGLVLGIAVLVLSNGANVK